MSELDDETPPPRRPAKPAAPLPRIREYSLEPEAEPPPKPLRKQAEPAAEKAEADEAKSRKGKSKASGEKPAKTESKEGAPKPERKRLLEDETPRLDTYEGRRNVRVGLGAVAAAVFVLTMGWSMMRLFGSREQPYVEDDLTELATEPVAGALPIRQAPDALEREAEVALADARRFAEKGEADLTLRKLNTLVEAYPKTQAAATARQALERASQGLPVFVDAPLVVAEAAAPAPVEEAPPAPVIAAEPVRPSFEPGPAVVNVTPPVTRPEPRKSTGLVMESAQRPALPLPAGFRAREEAGVHPSGWPLEITSDLDGSTLVFIPGGTFLMGRDDGEATERPAHRVALSPFYIDQHEVSVGQFDIFLANTRAGSAASGSESDNPRRPLTAVSFTQAQEYAAWAGKSLPTEAQWELSGRTIDGRVYPWGPSQPVWNPARTPGQLDPVMSHGLDMSPYGVFDLAGNAREWTSDFFRYYPPSLAGTVSVDPKVLDAGRSRTPTRVIKGGAGDWSLTWRRDMSPEAKLPDLGFRCVLVLPGVQAPAVPAEAPVAEPSPATPSRGLPAGVVPF